jgi:hypothetical protein
MHNGLRLRCIVKVIFRAPSCPASTNVAPVSTAA